MSDDKFERPAPAPCGEADTITARISGLRVELTATGRHSKAGYSVKFVKNLTDEVPPSFRLEHQAPAPAVSGVLKDTPFEVSQVFDLPESVVPFKELRVTTATGPQTVPVEHDKK